MVDHRFLQTSLFLALPALLTACGEDDGEGGAPDIFLGLSGLVIALIVIWLAVRFIGKRNGG